MVQFDPQSNVQQMSEASAGPGATINRTSLVLDQAASAADVLAGPPVEARIEPTAKQSARSFTWMIPMTDVIAILLSMVVAVGLVTLGGRQVDTFRLVATVGLMLPVWFVIAYVAGLYSQTDMRIDHRVTDELGKVVIAITAWSWLLLVVRTALSVGPTAMAGPILLWGSAIPLMLGARAMVRALARRRNWQAQPVVLLGEWLGVSALKQRIERNPDWGLDISAAIEFDEDLPADTGWVVDDVCASGVERVMIVGDGEGLSARTQLVNELVGKGLTVDIVSGGKEALYANAALQDLEGLPVLTVKPNRMKPMDLRMKRILDIMVASIGLFLTSPILVWAMIRIKRDSPGPIFFRQVRCGQHGEAFELLKLRTMVDGADEMRDGLREATAGSGNDDVLFKLKDDPRVTPVGRTLRKWSIDELPQLWHVLIGDMSMVGPRPLVFDEALQAAGVFEARTRVKPGIAGPWQAYGRSNIPFSEMVKLDYSYVVGWSMAEDLRLLLDTSVAVLRRRGAH